MRFYLAGRYSRREELCTYQHALEAQGHTVTSTWLRGVDAEFDATLPPERAAGWAQQDLVDLARAEVVLAFTEQPDSPYGRGGRHVEAGVALAWNKLLIVIGPLENAFYCLERIKQFDTWQDFSSSYFLRKSA